MESFGDASFESFDPWGEEVKEKKKKKKKEAL